MVPKNPVQYALQAAQRLRVRYAARTVRNRVCGNRRPTNKETVQHINRGAVARCQVKVRTAVQTRQERGSRTGAAGNRNEPRVV